MSVLSPKEHLDKFNRIADEVISFVRNSQKPVSIKEIEDNFLGSDFRIQVGRVVWQLLADRKLYLTEDRRVSVSN